ncbi:alpha/beta hydrolase [Corynebacterium imitans]|uniref:Alpha/beta hydrolase n=1 Tax=Corynebacterium imitans TaxID=156978 RepID=A0A239ZLV3_9CORY|nr:alpha/beta fold hydrolase [Corynebacterium imitans]MDK8307391.1 alpha/beta fold hydrolase [Corynebacterium imitans]MDK8637250.1 alpha/beta fold hydrolase [Corynebacterium imitans]MDK8772574.1 alpha/beta fold hydrolase [Corynebacterium imitans]SNV71783.1 alpha/beta hydrolase [Corynebacterium imitans]
MKSLNLKVPSSTGLQLAATMDRPDGPAKAYAIFAHCFAGSRHTPGASRISKRLTEHGIATLRFDFPGLGQSEGEFAETSFSQNVDDIVAVAQWMEEHFTAPQLIMGHSLGGAAVLKAATRPELKKMLKMVATVGAPFDPAHSVLHYADKIGEADANGSVHVTLGGRELVISRHFLEDLAETNPEEYLGKVRKPLLVVHSPIDVTVGIDNAQTIFQLTRYPKSLMALDKADHLLTRQGTAQRAADIIGSWAQQYIVPEFTPESTGDSNAISYSARGTKYGDVVRTSGREITTDRAKNAGGKGQGVTSTGLFMSALAVSCSQAIRIAAKGMPLDDVRVEVTHDADTTFTRHITLYGDLTDEQVETLRAAGAASTVDGYVASNDITTTVDTATVEQRRERDKQR